MDGDRLRMTGPSWLAVGPGAAVAISAGPVAGALPGKELCGSSFFCSDRPFFDGEDLSQKMVPPLYLKMVRLLESHHSLLALV